MDCGFRWTTSVCAVSGVDVVGNVKAEWVVNSGDHVLLHQSPCHPSW